MEPNQLDQFPAAEAPGPIFWIVFLAILIVMIAALWKVFAKAGEPGWAAIIPIYNVMVLLKISGKPLWWIILFIIPIANLIVSILASLGLSKNFGKSDGFGIGLALLPFIFFPILGFGSATFAGQKTA